jgi:hypothetical protein
LKLAAHSDITFSYLHIITRKWKKISVLCLL